MGRRPKPVGDPPAALRQSAGLHAVHLHFCAIAAQRLEDVGRRHRLPTLPCCLPSAIIHRLWEITPNPFPTLDTRLGRHHRLKFHRVQNSSTASAVALGSGCGCSAPPRPPPSQSSWCPPHTAEELEELEERGERRQRSLLMHKSEHKSRTFTCGILQ